MKLFLDTAKFSILTIIAVGFAAVGIAITTVLGIKRGVVER
jgi:hypothetical protein